jgi:hypothetical protein
MRYLAKIEKDNKEHWLMSAHMEAPWRREALVELAQHMYENESWASCLHFSKKALEIKEKPLDYLCEDFAWGYLPWDLAAIASYYEGDLGSALSYGRAALELDPTNARLQENMKFYIA